MSNNRKYLGIRFPFTARDSESFYVDLDHNPYVEIKSALTHLLYTPKGQRLRNPSFGTNLLAYIFEPKDSKTMTDIKIEMQEIMKKYFPGIILEDIKVSQDDVNSGVSVELNYRIDEGSHNTFDSIKINM